MEEKFLDGAALELALKNDAFTKSSTIELVGMVKPSKEAGFVGFTKAGCETWIDLPVSMIEQAQHRGNTRCKDHSHPVFSITLKTPQDPEAQILAALLAQTPAARPNPYGGPVGMAGPAGMAPPDAMSSLPGQDMSFRAGTIRRSDSGQSMMPGNAAARINTGGLHGPRGGFGAWGCWDSCCEQQCLAGHVQQGPTGTSWVCDWWVCVDPCEKCIWPW